MESGLRDPNGYSPGDVVERLKRFISSGVEGIDYTVKQRTKNEKLFADYCITTQRRREILLSLTADDYVKWEYSNNENYKSIVHFFEKKVSLIPRYIEDAKEQQVDLYIKITWDETAGNILVVISFHEKEY